MNMEQEKHIQETEHYMESELEASIEPESLSDMESIPEAEMFITPEPQQVQEAEPTINYAQIREWVKNIRVQPIENEMAIVENPTPLPIIWRGKRNALFRVGKDLCVKVFANEQECNREHEALSMAQNTGLVPHIFDKGTNYIFMEEITGVSLHDYLLSQPLTKEISLKLIEMLKKFKEIGYKMIDHHKRRILLQADGSIKVFDVAHMVWRERMYSFPRKLINSLGNDHKEVFLSHVQELAPKLYEEWQQYMKIDQMARDVYQVVTKNDLPDDEDAIRALSQPLLTMSDKKKYFSKLEGLVRKIYKEEWNQGLIEQGHDPDKVKEEIDRKIVETETEEVMAETKKDSENDKHADKYADKQVPAMDTSKTESQTDDEELDLFDHDEELQRIRAKFYPYLDAPERRKKRSSTSTSTGSSKKQKNSSGIEEEIYRHLTKKKSSTKSKKKSSESKKSTVRKDKSKNSEQSKKNIDGYIKKQVEKYLESNGLKEKAKPKLVEDKKVKASSKTTSKSSEKSSSKGKSNTSSKTKSESKTNSLTKLKADSKTKGNKSSAKVSSSKTKSKKVS